MTRILFLEDVDQARELHALAFPDDNWVGDNHQFWVAREAGVTVGFASAKAGPSMVFLSRAAVVKAAAGMGVHRLMIKHRVAWAADHGMGCHTYTTLQNYPSMVNLLACGFRFYKPSTPWVGKRVHYFIKTL